MFFPNGETRNPGSYIGNTFRGIFDTQGSENWISQSNYCIVLNPDKITVTPQTYTMNYIDLPQISDCESIEQGFGEDQRMKLRKRVYRQTFTNNTADTVTINTLGLLYTRKSYSPSDTLATRIDLGNNGKLPSEGGVTSDNLGILLAAEPLDTPTTLQASESKTFQMTFQLTE